MHNLRKFKDKSPGMNGNTRNMLLNVPNNCILAMLEIYNESYTARYFPDIFKVAKMIFLKKPVNDPREISYRPISLLDVMGKSLEKY